jgi:hypothetical protein
MKYVVYSSANLVGITWVIRTNLDDSYSPINQKSNIARSIHTVVRSNDSPKGQVAGFRHDKESA